MLQYHILQQLFPQRIRETKFLSSLYDHFSISLDILNSNDGLAGPPTHAYIRSCTDCRHRKVKCDRQQPCSQCIRVGLGTDCVNPPGPGRAAKRSQGALDSQLLDRLSRLETIIRRLDPKTSSPPPMAANDESSLAVENASSEASTSDNSSSINQQLGRLVIDDTRSYYINNILWASLGNEVCDMGFNWRCACLRS